MYQDNVLEEYLKFVEHEKNMFKYGGHPNVEVIDDIMYLEPWHRAVNIGIDMKEWFDEDRSMKQYFGA